MLAIPEFNTFGLRPKDIIGFAYRDTLAKFPPSIGINMPLGSFLVTTTDVHLDAIDREIIGAPYGPKDQSIVERLRLGFFARWQWHTNCRE